MQAANVVERAVIRFPDQRIHGAHLFVPRLLQRPSDDRLDRRADRQGVREDDRRLDRAELVHLRRARELAERVADEYRARHLLLKEISAVRQNRGDAGAHSVAFDNRRLSHRDAAHVGDGVQRTRRKRPRGNPEISGARSTRRTGLNDDAKGDGDRERQQSHPNSRRASYDGRMRRLVVFTTVLLTTWTALVARSSSTAVPDILISRQLFERERLAIGETVELSRATDGAARQFRVAGIYDPTPDPMRFAQERLEVRVHLPDAAALDEGNTREAGSLTAINVRLTDPADADRFASDVERRLPGVAARSTTAPDERTSTFAVLDRFHLAIAIVTMLGSGAFLLALMVMLVDERRETVATLRLIGLTKRRLIAQILAEGALIAAAGAVFGIVLRRRGAAGVQSILPVALRHGARLRARHPCDCRSGAWPSPFRSGSRRALSPAGRSCAAARFCGWPDDVARSRLPGSECGVNPGAWRWPSRA